MQSELSVAISDGACLIDTNDSVSDLKSVLIGRLCRYYTRRGSGSVTDTMSLEDVQIATAREAISVIERVQKIIGVEESPGQDQPPLIGTRDLAQLHILLSIVFKWGLDPLYAKVVLTWPEGVSLQGKARIIDLAASSEDYATLSSFTSSILHLVFPDGVRGRIPQSHITTAILERHTLDILKSSIMLGWIPKSLSTVQTITALGGVLSSNPPQFVRKQCVLSLGQQLLRPQGIRGLFIAVFGEEDAAAVDYSPIEKLEHVARVLMSAPSFIAPEGGSSHSSDGPSPSEALSTLITLVSNADPSPTLISTLLSPIASTLYSLLYHMDHVKTTDPSLRESLRGLLITWAKIVTTSDGVTVLWSIIESEDTGWKIDLEGQITKTNASEKPAKLSLMTPQDLEIHENEDFDLDTNILGLYPDPSHFVQFLKTIDRTDISSDLFVQLLEAYRDHKTKEEKDPTRVLLYLQTIMQMQARLTDGKSSRNILCKPAHLLFFVKHILEPQKSSSEYPGRNKQRRMKQFERFQLDSDIEDETPKQSDSDDDTPGAQIISPDEEMVETSVHLLLSILEANKDLSARTAPVLNDIFSLLEPIAREGSETMRPLAQEARMVMTSRLAYTSSRCDSGSYDQDKENVHEIYQKALKLLQDPILPVRAHGLLLLRELISPVSMNPKTPKLDNPAFLPAILSIFLQSVHDDDSYIFLNAVQGLAAMVDRFGKEVLKGLVKEYSDGLAGLGATNLTQHELGARTRVGEALAVVIRRFGEALGNYVDILVPPIFNILRIHHIPTALRTSSISLLADCQTTYPLAMLPYAEDLAEAMLDILQIEIMPAEADTSSPEDGAKQGPNLDSEPTMSSSKIPPLRRAAIHFLSLLIRDTTKQIYNTSLGQSILSDTFIKRAKTTLGYVAYTDEDNIVRVMAREAGEGLVELNNAIMGVF
ncbi:hypothetical protein H0H81_003277 [Sphagnurus paluster]|uniref:RNA polymerase II assembly factor Rtp1 C-terminal domain-containing protein n=1 Tax=Sphagnurus paluster TaxID=117069 RepID=A0A9P7FV83_9AGAR|nr:hypothetical protein H0H81_003277 [Sphagnurus paluster]